MVFAALPDSAGFCQVEEPFLVSYFRRIFQRISSHDEGVTKKQLHEVGAEAGIVMFMAYQL